MKLNHDCIRYIMLYLENYLTVSNYFLLDPYSFCKNNYLETYSNSDVLYSCEKLIEAGYINGKIKNFTDITIPQIKITSITWEGHKFLDNIRDDKVWKNTKSILSQFKTVSISFISEVAAQIISKLINKQLGLE